MADRAVNQSARHDFFAQEILDSGLGRRPALCRCWFQHVPVCFVRLGCKNPSCQADDYGHDYHLQRKGSWMDFDAMFNVVSN